MQRLTLKRNLSRLRICLIAAVLVLSLLATACAHSQSTDGGALNTPSSGEHTSQVPMPDKEQISLDDFAIYSGQYVEDGQGEAVENVAAIRVTNHSEQFLDFATVVVNISGKTARFVVTGLPAGRSAWVLEANRMTAEQSSVFKMVDCVTSFREDVIAKTEKVTVSAEGNVLTATNHTEETLENVFVYYRTVHTDGYFLGGITYLVNFGTLEPGKSAQSTAGHYTQGPSEIVRIGWKDQ